MNNDIKFYMLFIDNNEDNTCLIDKIEIEQCDISNNIYI